MSNIEILLNAIKVPGESRVLTKEEEITLGRTVQDPNTTAEARQEAIELLVVKNIYLVLKLVHKYKRTFFEFEDLVGYGILGLFSAASKFDPGRGIRFASYARHWIKEAVMKAIREYSGTPKIPVYLVKNLWSVTRVINKNSDISDEKLSGVVSLDIPTVKYLRSLLFKTVQFDPEYSGLDTQTPEQNYLLKERKEIFQTALEEYLTADERIVLSNSCELEGCKKLTFAKIEEKFKIKNARKLKATAVQKLGEHPQLKMLFLGD